MTIKIFEKFSPRANPADGNYPYGSIKNESVPGAKDGTPLDAEWGNDYAGFDAALLAEAGIVPSGNADTAVNSQRLEAMKQIAGNLAHIGPNRNPAGAHKASAIDTDSLGTVEDALNDSALKINKINKTIGQSLQYSDINGVVPTKKSAIVKSSDTEFLHYTHLGGQTWQVGLLQNQGLDSEGRITPYGWNQTIVQDLSEAIIFGDSGVVANGTWTDLSTVNALPYYGHRAAQSTIINNYIEITFDNTVDGAELSLLYNSRIEGNIVDVTIDGSTALLNEATTVDTYSATTEYRQRQLLATNLPAKVGSYVIRFTLSASKNPLASTVFNVFGFNGIVVSGGSFGSPWNEGVRPKPFTATVPVARYEEVVGANGAIYVCSIAGTTGATAPSHASGSATNGTATFVRLSQSSFILSEDNYDVIQSQGSQLEYAYEFRKTGDVAYQDVGGSVHGNEYLQSSVEIYADGFNRQPSTGKFIVGDQIQFRQTIKAYYGTVSVNEPLADTILVHSLVNGKVIVSHTQKYLLDGEFGFYYPAMWPLTAYNAVNFKKSFDTMQTPQAGYKDLLDYSGVVNPIVGKEKDYQMNAFGEIYRPTGSAGVPSSDPGKYSISTQLRITDLSVGIYEYGDTFAGMATNLSGASSMSGYSSWAIKMYFGRSNTGKPEPVVTGKTINSVAEYKLSLVRK